VSKRLQVLIPDNEMSKIQRIAPRPRTPEVDPQFRLKAIRRAAEYSFPTAEIDRMNREIESGYLSRLPD
jgi:hypothetical protein